MKTTQNQILLEPDKNLINTLNRPSHLWISLAATALLLPFGLFADPPLHMTSGADAWTGTSYSRTQDTTNTDVTSLRDQQQMSGPGTFESLNLSAEFGSLSASLTASSSQPGKPNPQITGGSAYANGEMHAYTAITVSSPSIASGSYGRMQVVILTEGDATGANTEPFNYASGGAGYGWSAAVGGVSGIAGVTFGGGYSDAGWAPPEGNGNATFSPIGAIGTVILTNYFAPGVAHPFDMNLSCSAGAYIITESSTEPRSASGSLDFRARLVRVVATDDQDQPISFTMQSDIGSERGDLVQARGSYSGLTLVNTAPGRVGTTATMLGGVADAIEQVLMTFQAPPHDVALASDAIDINGTGQNAFVLQLNYAPALAQSLFGNEKLMRLVWRNPATKKWVNAVAGNVGGAASFVKRAFDPALDTQLGRFGIDILNHVVWGVFNHNSEFAVAAPPVRLSISKTGNGKIAIDGSGGSLEHYMIQSTSDLHQAFADLSAVTAAADGSFHFEEPLASAPHFYRAVEQTQ